ncbi:cellulose biosynthesis protein BcsQ [Pseudomonas sp. A3.4]|nr:cellulose biosynthesis protein BcsQ [Atopomonas sediminilitoris]
MAANIAAALHKVGRPVLAIDLDPQNALHHHFQPEGEVSEEQGVVRFEQDWREQAVPTKDGVFVLPYGLGDEAQRRIFEAQLADDPLWLAYRLSDLELSEGAVVVIDTPPGPSVYLQQALAVANVALVVSLADAASYTALPMIDRLIASYTDERDDFAGTAYVVNQIDPSRQLNKDITHVMHGLLGDRLIGRITRDQSISEALAYNRNVMDYDPHGRGCRDILDCTMALVGYFASDDEGA